MYVPDGSGRHIIFANAKEKSTFDGDKIANNISGELPNKSKRVELRGLRLLTPAKTSYQIGKRR